MMGQSGPESRHCGGYSHTMGHCARDDVRYDVLLYMWCAAVWTGFTPKLINR